MRYIPIDSSLFIKNRAKLFAKLPSKSVAVFNANDIMPTNADGVMPFKQNSDLFYLSGIDQEETILVLFKDSESKQQSYLFIRETSDLIRVWEGYKLTKAEATQLSGVTEVFWLDEFEAVFKALVSSAEIVFLNSNEHARATTLVQTRDNRFTSWCKRTYPEKQFKSVAALVTSLRYVKEPEEIAVIQKACEITDAAFRRVLAFTKPGQMEYEIEAEITHEFIKNGSRGHAYQPIVAAGGNSCVLHYVDNDRKCKDGDVLLMDFGAEYGCYNADLTRTIPVNGRFTDRQKAVYNAVLRVHQEAKKLLVPGNTFASYNKSIGELMQAELIGLGLLDAQAVKSQDAEKPLYRKYFMHGTSHSLGLDVHDVDDRLIPFEENMVFTVEPGIYIPEENIGVRIENDVVVKKGGVEDLMANIPIEVEEIEDLMNKK